MNSRSLHIVSLALLAGLCSPDTQAQIIVPDRLPSGQRMSALVTPADWGSLPFDSLRSFPHEAGKQSTWWQRHALFVDGQSPFAMDPVMDISFDRRRTQLNDGTSALDKGHRNVRGVRYAGLLDGKVHFGGQVLEMQRLLVGPETEYVLAAQQYPGMGTGKLRPSENGLYAIDHSLAEVWFDTHLHPRLRVQWGIGSTGLGPGTRNLLWNGSRAPAPYLLLEADLGKGWTYRWLQSRQKGVSRLPANGAREGRYVPLGLGIRSLSKSVQGDHHRLDITIMVARWTRVLDRGDNRARLSDWGSALAPWAWPNLGEVSNPWYAAGHQGIDIQWRAQRSTWYGQMRIAPLNDPRYSPLIEAAEVPSSQMLFGHVRHGKRLTVWTEWAPTTASSSSSLDPDMPMDGLGIESWSPFRPSWIQGMEWRPFNWSIAIELGMTKKKDFSWKARISRPTAVLTKSKTGSKKGDSSGRYTKWLPALVPISPFFSFTQIPQDRRLYWSFGVTSPLIKARKTH